MLRQVVEKEVVKRKTRSLGSPETPLILITVGCHIRWQPFLFLPSNITAQIILQIFSHKILKLKRFSKNEFKFAALQHHTFKLP